MREKMNDSISYIEKLEMLQETMPSFESIVSSMHGSFVQYEMDQGFAIGHGVLHDHDCAVQKYFATANSVFPEHIHDEWEYFIVIRGEGTIVIDGKESTFKAKDCIVIEPGQTHLWRYDTPVEMIAVTIPASRGFPSGEG